MTVWRRAESWRTTKAAELRSAVRDHLDGTNFDSEIARLNSWTCRNNCAKIG
jgi:hypothetical protein